VQAQILALLERAAGELGMAIVDRYDRPWAWIGRDAEIEIRCEYAGRIVETAATEALLNKSEHPILGPVRRPIPTLDGPRLERRADQRQPTRRLITRRRAVISSAAASTPTDRASTRFAPPADPPTGACLLVNQRCRRKLWRSPRERDRGADGGGATSKSVLQITRGSSWRGQSGAVKAVDGVSFE